MSPPKKIIKLTVILLLYTRLTVDRGRSKVKVYHSQVVLQSVVLRVVLSYGIRTENAHLILHSATTAGCKLHIVHCTQATSLLGARSSCFLTSSEE